MSPSSIDTTKVYSLPRWEFCCGELKSQITSSLAKGCLRNLSLTRKRTIHCWNNSLENCSTTYVRLNPISTWIMRILSKKVLEFMQLFILWMTMVRAADFVMQHLLFMGDHDMIRFKLVVRMEQNGLENFSSFSLTRAWIWHFLKSMTLLMNTWNACQSLDYPGWNSQGHYPSFQLMQLIAWCIVGLTGSSQSVISWIILQIINKCWFP